MPRVYRSVCIANYVCCMQALSVLMILEEDNVDTGNVDINPLDTPERRFTVCLTIIMVFKSHFSCGTNSARIMS